MSIIVLSSCSGLLGAVGPHRRPVEPGEGGELGGGEGVLVQLNVLQTVSPPRTFTARRKYFTNQLSCSLSLKMR